MITAFASGFSIYATIVVSIGPQNTELLRVGMARQNAVLLAVVYVLCDIALLVFAVYGVEHLVDISPRVRLGLAGLAVLFLLWLALRSLHAAFSTSARASGAFDHALPDVEGASAPEQQTRDRRPSMARRLVAHGVLLALVNPLGLIETIVIVGGIAGEFAPDRRPMFLAGAICTSVFWFLTLGFGARRLAPKLAAPRHQRVVEAVLGIALLAGATAVGWQAVLRA